MKLFFQIGHGDCDIVDDCIGSSTCGENSCRRYNPLAEADADCCQSGTELYCTAHYSLLRFAKTDEMKKCIETKFIKLMLNEKLI